MPLIYLEIESEVVDKLTKSTFDSMLAYVVKEKPLSWGEQQPREFFQQQFVLAMYHDITAIGYNKTAKAITGLGYLLNHKS